jgi:hypothetical protein
MKPKKIECGFHETCEFEVCIINGKEVFRCPYNTDNPKTFAELIKENNLDPKMWEDNGIRWSDRVIYYWLKWFNKRKYREWFGNIDDACDRAIEEIKKIKP